MTIIVAPKRHEELITEEGFPTLRFITFLESLIPPGASSVFSDFTTSGNITLICTNGAGITIRLKYGFRDDQW